MKEYIVKLIKDEPKLYKDNYIHQQISESIIKAYDDCNSVALYGSWGSGKSSIVKMVSSQLGKEITFDFWKTSGDKLKRTFLEILLKDTNNQSLTIKNGDKDVSVLDMITGRYQEIKTDTTFKELSILQKITTIIFLSIVSFFTLTNAYKIVISYMPNAKLPDLLYLALFFIIPATIWACIFLCMKTKDIAQLVSRKISMISTNEIKQNSSTSSDLNEPAFLDIYHKIIERVEENENRYLVCLDNLDRMDKAKVKDVLDDIYLFISSSNCKYIKFIIPLNNIVIIDVFKDTSDSESNNDNFIHKLLPIYFELPNLINFDWRYILKTKAKEAFVDIDTPLINEIALIFEATMSRTINVVGTIDNYNYAEKPRTTNYNLTPRDIIYFINSMVSTYWLVAKLSIDLRDIALYVGIKQYNNKITIDNYFKDFKAEKPSIINYFKDDERVKNLYKIHYQTDTPYETLLRHSITNAIVSKDSDTIKEMLANVEISVASFLSSIINEYKDIDSHNYEDIYFYYDLAKKLSCDNCNIHEMIMGFKDILFNVITNHTYDKWGDDKTMYSNNEIKNLIDFLEEQVCSDKETSYINNFWFRELDNIANIIKKKQISDSFTNSELNTIIYLYSAINQKKTDKVAVCQIVNEIITAIKNLKLTDSTNKEAINDKSYLQLGIPILAESLYFLKQNKQDLPIDINDYWNTHIDSNYILLTAGFYYFLNDNLSNTFIKTILTLNRKVTLVAMSVKSQVVSLISNHYKLIISNLNQYTEQEISCFFTCLDSLHSESNLVLKNLLVNIPILDSINIILALIKDSINNCDILPTDWYSNNDIRGILANELDEDDFIKVIEVAWQKGSSPTSDKEWSYYWERVDPLVINKDWDNPMISILTQNASNIPANIGSKLLQDLNDYMYDSNQFTKLYELVKDYFKQKKCIDSLQNYFSKLFVSPIGSSHADIIKSASVADLKITAHMLNRFKDNAKEEEKSGHTKKAIHAIQEKFPELYEKLLKL